MTFMLVGHMHEKIDVLFQRWNTPLKKINLTIILLFVKSFMNVESFIQLHTS
jgi:hypothetical protein